MIFAKDQKFRELPRIADKPFRDIFPKHQQDPWNSRAIP